MVDDKDVRRLRELDIVVPDDLDAVAPRIEKIEKRTRHRTAAGVGQCFADSVFLEHLPAMVENEKDAAVRGGAQAEARFQACADRWREAAAHGAQLSWLTKTDFP